MQPELKSGDPITVYDRSRVELGEGTFFKLEFMPELGMWAYQCREHTILVKGPHFVKCRGQTWTVGDKPD